MKPVDKVIARHQRKVWQVLTRGGNRDNLRDAIWKSFHYYSEVAAGVDFQPERLISLVKTLIEDDNHRVAEGLGRSDGLLGKRSTSAENRTTSDEAPQAFDLDASIRMLAGAFRDCISPKSDCFEGRRNSRGSSRDSRGQR